MDICQHYYKCFVRFQQIMILLPQYLFHLCSEIYLQILFIENTFVYENALGYQKRKLVEINFCRIITMNEESDKR